MIWIKKVATLTNELLFFSIILLIMSFFIKSITSFWVIGFMTPLVIIFFLEKVLFPKQKKVRFTLKKLFNVLRENKQFILLFFMDLLILISIIFSEKKLYAIEWTLLPIFLTSIIFIFFKIDSRFQIIWAILGLAYCPFLLIAKRESFAENIAIYVYFFLLVGIIHQFYEYQFKKEPTLDFGKNMFKLINSRFFLTPLIVFTILSISSFFLTKYYVIYALRYTFVYFAFLSLVLMVIYWLKLLDE